MKCEATSKSTGKPCRNDAIKGTTRCRQHPEDPDTPVGRPTKVDDPTVVKRLETALATGATRKASAIYAGISEASFYHYLERGEADREANQNTPYSEFLETVTRAEARADVLATTAIRTAMSPGVDSKGRTIPGDWRAAAWYLERRHPAEWGRQDRHQVEHSGAIARQDIPEIPETDERFLEVQSVLRGAGIE